MIYDDGELSLKELREIDWCGRWKVYPMCAITQEARIRGCGLLVADMIVLIVWYSFSSCSFSSSIFLWLKTFLPFDKKKEKSPHFYTISTRHGEMSHWMRKCAVSSLPVASSFLRFYSPLLYFLNIPFFTFWIGAWWAIKFIQDKMNGDWVGSPAYGSQRVVGRQLIEYAQLRRYSTIPTNWQHTLI